MEERLQKLLSAAGVCSRRQAETYIQAGRVMVNGRQARLGDKADLLQDRVEVDGVPLTQTERFTYIMLNKPRGYVTTLADEKGRRNVATVRSGYGRWAGWTWIQRDCCSSQMMVRSPTG